MVTSPGVSVSISTLRRVAVRSQEVKEVCMEVEEMPYCARVSQVFDLLATRPPDPPTRTDLRSLSQCKCARYCSKGLFTYLPRTSSHLMLRRLNERSRTDVAFSLSLVQLIKSFTGRSTNTPASSLAGKESMGTSLLSFNLTPTAFSSELVADFPPSPLRLLLAFFCPAASQRRTITQPSSICLPTHTRTSGMSR